LDKELKGNWNEQKGKLKQKFAILTDNVQKPDNLTTLGLVDFN
jgi:uncharacterized protein YjbJ (UPF0337 family)